MSKDEKFTIIYKKYSDYLRNICNKYIKDPDEAEDCMHDSFIKIYNNLDGVDLDSCTSFLSTITKNNAIDYIRKMKHSKYTYDIDECSSSALSFYSTDSDYCQYRDLKRFLKDNSKIIGTINYKIFCMYVYGNLKHKEIAEKLGMNINTVRVNYMKAKKIIQKIIKDEFNQRQMV